MKQQVLWKISKKLDFFRRVGRGNKQSHIKKKNAFAANDS